jgi:hypothetical protein
MAQRNSTPDIAVIAIADLIDGYVSNSLGNSEFQTDIKNLLQKLDPNKDLSKQMLKGIKSRLDRRAREENQNGKRMRSISWGAIRSLNDNQIGEIIKPKPIRFLEDDVGQQKEPNYPSDTNFTIKYQGLYCKDRTGDRGWFGPSDEPYVITSTVHVNNGDNVVRTERHPVGYPDKRYGDVDSGEYRNGPVSACWFGKENEVSLISTVMENDEGDPDAYKEQINALVEIGALVAKSYGVNVPDYIKGLVVDAINWVIDSDDDVIGVESITLSPYFLKIYASQNDRNFHNNGRTVPITHDHSMYHDEDGKYYSFFTVEADKPPSNSGDWRDLRIRLENYDDSRIQI